jgi:uncharacterized protein involved in exopolysaccharide biosynthesis
MPEVRDSSLVQRLKEDLAMGEAKLSELATQYGKNHPAYQRQVSQNDALRERLAGEMRHVAAGIESSARQSRQRQADLTAALAAQRARLLQQRESRDEIAVLRRNVEAAEGAYTAVLQRASVAQIDSRARQTNVVMLNAAVAPAQPTSPRIFLNIALSVAVGTMLGMGVVLVMEMLDRRVRSLDDFDNAWEAPLLVVLDPWRPPAHLRLAAPQPDGRALPNPG